MKIKATHLLVSMTLCCFSLSASAEGSGLKVKDMNNRGISSENTQASPSISEKQKQELLKTMEKIKTSRAEQQKYLDQLLLQEN